MYPKVPCMWQVFVLLIKPNCQPHCNVTFHSSMVGDSIGFLLHTIYATNSGVINIIISGIMFPQKLIFGNSSQWSKPTQWLTIKLCILLQWLLQIVLFLFGLILFNINIIFITTEIQIIKPLTLFWEKIILYDITLTLFCVQVSCLFKSQYSQIQLIRTLRGP